MELEHVNEKALLDTNDSPAPDTKKLNDSFLPNERPRPSNVLSSSLSSTSEFEDPVDTTNSLIGDSKKNSLSPYSFTDTSVGENSTKDSPVESPVHSPLESPLVQKMELPLDGLSNYRIPSHVFGAANSKAQIEWSATSNESLFSIQMGTMSFTKEQFNYLIKSGELSAAEIAKLGNPTKSIKQEDPGKQKLPAQGQANIATSSNNREKVGGEGHDCTSNKEGLTLKTKDSKNGIASIGDESYLFSGRHSDASNQSFAFPVLATDVGRGSSVKSGHVQTYQQHKTDRVGSQAPENKPAQSSLFTTCFSWCPCS